MGNWQDLTPALTPAPIVVSFIYFVFRQARLSTLFTVQSGSFIWRGVVVARKRLLNLH